MPKTGMKAVEVSLKLKDEGFKKQLNALRDYLNNLSDLHKDLGDFHRDLGRRLQILFHQAERVDELFEIKTK